MPRFRTVITHKPGSFIDVAGERIELEPDPDGFCEFEASRPAVVARLLQIPEGFELLTADKPADADVIVRKRRTK